MESKRICVALALCAAPVLFAARLAAEPAAAPEALPELTPYRAVYDLTLSHSSGAKTLASASGRISRELSASSCGGYLANVHQFTELRPADGPPRLAEMRTTTFETVDGKGFEFKIESRGGGGQRKLSGEAKRDGRAALSVKLTEPQRHLANLADDAMFPAEHLRRVLAAARADQQAYDAKIYDASGDGAKVMETTTLIGKPTTAEATEKAAQAPQLKGMRRWPVTVSYFKPGVLDGAPVLVMSFELYDNGVARKLKLDYGNFTLSGEMTELAFATTPAKCEKGLTAF